MIILNALGQTCNKLFTYLHYLGDSIETEEKLIILSPDITIKDFPNIKSSNLIKFPLFNELLSKLIGYNFYIKTLRILFANKYSLKLLALVFKPIPGIRLIVAPTNSNNSKNYLNHIPELKKVFTPKPEIIAEVNSLFKNYRKNHEIICGIHIRRGDYKSWRNGKYYYSPSQYKIVMEKINSAFTNKSILFFISSNEKIDSSIFLNLNCFSIPHSSAVKDLYGLSICDFIAGPPSTYSGWASFYGDTPLYFIENPNNEIEISQFKHILEIWG